MQIAEQLYTTLWGKHLNVILEEISDDDGTTWKYVPKTHIDSLQTLGYTESCGLLLRPEYDITFRALCQDSETAKARQCGGVVVTGQPGIGKTCFLYYILLRRLSEGRPVALEQPKFFILFHEGGVYRYSLNADTRYLPDGTWALSDSNDEAPQPCTTFRSASKLRTAWLIQTTSPSGEEVGGLGKVLRCGYVRDEPHFHRGNNNSWVGDSKDVSHSFTFPHSKIFGVDV
ncbi:hypothetical protein EDB84DRAFT_1506460, partial [Lactarius hengduanensis]